jgi:hypothetical protein
MKKNFTLLIFILATSTLSLAQNLLGIYEFTGTGACPNQNPSVSSQPINATFGNFVNQNVNCVSTNNVFNNAGWNTTLNFDLNEYIGFKITADDCYRVNIDSLVFSYRNSGSENPPTWYLRSSIDDFEENIAAAQSENPGTSLITNQINLLNTIYDEHQEVEFRIYLTGIATNSTTFRVDDVKLYGNISYVGPIDLYVDADGDGYGTGTVVQTFCSNPGGYATNNTDCNDSDPLLNPATIWYEDLDNDDYGNNLVFQIGCTHTFTNATLLGNDCNENDPLINPTTIWYEDEDGDGFGNPNNFENNCYSVSLLNPVLNNEDCMDDQATVYPGAPEICDEFDNNCDGDINEDISFTTYYIDNDGDNYGAGSAGDFCNDPGLGYSLNNDDCDDDDNTVNPAGIDLIGDLIDQNCDGVIDGYLGLNEINTITFSVIPNPGNDMINVTSTQSGVMEIRNIEGKIIRKVSIDTNATVNMSDVSTGIYFITINQQTIKWLKQ